MNRLPAALPFLAAGFLVIGCHAVDAEAPSSATGEQRTEPRAETDLSARIEAVPLIATLGQCSIAMSYLQVKLDDAKAAAAINAVLERSVDDFVTKEDCKESYTLEGASTARFNEQSVLSVTRKSTWAYASDPHPNHVYGATNFDLRTGAVIALRDAVDDAGRQILVSTCASVLGEGLADEIFVEYCRGAIEDDRPVYGVEAEGLRVHPVGLPHAGFAMVERGVLVPWSSLAGHVTHDLLQAIASSLRPPTR